MEAAGAAHLHEVLARLRRLVHVQPGRGSSSNAHPGLSVAEQAVTGGQGCRSSTHSTVKVPTLVSNSTTGAAMGVSAFNTHTTGAHVAA